MGLSIEALAGLLLVTGGVFVGRQAVTRIGSPLPGFLLAVGGFILLLVT